MLIASHLLGEAIFLEPTLLLLLNCILRTGLREIWRPLHCLSLTSRDLHRLAGFTAITLIVTFCIIDMFDTIGTLVGTASRAGMLDKGWKNA